MNSLFKFINRKFTSPRKEKNALEKKNFKQLPKTLGELDVGYRMLIKELGKR
jgi:hypothetical protein